MDGPEQELCDLWPLCERRRFFYKTCFGWSIMKQSFNLSAMTPVFPHRQKCASDYVSPSSDETLHLAIHLPLPAGTRPSFSWRYTFKIQAPTWDKLSVECGSCMWIEHMWKYCHSQIHTAGRKGLQGLTVAGWYPESQGAIWSSLPTSAENVIAGSN